MSRNRIITVVVGVLVVGAVALVVALWNFAGPPEAGGSTTPPSSTTAPGEVVSPPPSQWPTPEPGSTEDIDPGEPLEVAIEEPATVAGVSASVAGIESFEVGDSEQPGQLAGPAVTVTIEVVNDSGAAVDLGGASVNLDFGSEHTPAPSIGDPVMTGLPATLASGARGRGEYSFSLPLDKREYVRVILDLVSGEPQVVFVGSMIGN